MLGLLAKQESLPQLSGTAGSWPGANDTTSTATADGTSSGEDKPPGLVQYSATAESELSEHSDEGEAGPSRSGALGHDQPRKVWW